MRNPRRSWSFVLLVVLVGAAAAVSAFVIIQTLNTSPPWQRPAGGTEAAPATPVRPGRQPSSPPANAAIRRVLDRADNLLKAGKLKEAQDAYLDVLLTSDPNHSRAMNGLVQVRRRVTDDSATLLRWQGDAYKAAAGRGGGGGEHYTAQALGLLARASYLAVVQIELHPPASRGAGRPAPPSPAVAPTAVAQPDAPVTPPSPSTQAETSAPAPAPSEPAAPQIIVRVGPLGDSDSAQNMATQFQREGLAVRVSTEISESARRYLVVSEPTSPQIAEARVRSLATLGIKATVAELDGGLVRLMFGASNQSDEAGALASTIRSRGYPAIVIPEGGTMYFVVIGPHEEAQIDKVLGRLRSGVLPVEVAPAP
jgi:hypothetical protein